MSPQASLIPAAAHHALVDPLQIFEGGEFHDHLPSLPRDVHADASVEVVGEECFELEDPRGREATGLRDLVGRGGSCRDHVVRGGHRFRFLPVGGVRLDASTHFVLYGPDRQPFGRRPPSQLLLERAIR